MKKIFLGRPVHWLLAIVLVFGGAGLGEMRLHVTDFNLFLIVMLAAVVVLLGLVLKTSGREDQVTRDPIPAPSEQETSESASAG